MIEIVTSSLEDWINLLAKLILKLVFRIFNFTYIKLYIRL